jgi:hypothetical protein
MAKPYLGYLFLQSFIVGFREQRRWKLKRGHCEAAGSSLYPTCTQPHQ